VKKTAVEWLEKEFIKIESTVGVYGVMYELIERAKEMEKEQTLEFIRNAVRKILDEDRQAPFNLEQYYNETYGK
jgi:hypothetical protein